MNIFYIFLIQPITNILAAFYKLFVMLHIPYPLGFSLIALTVLIRAIFTPLYSKQIKTSQKMQLISKHAAKIREIHKDDKKKQQEEMLKLYKEHGINPASGCLLMLIQLPILWSLYSVMLSTLSANSPAAIQKLNNMLYSPFLTIHSWDTYFFGIPLFEKPSKLFIHSPLIILIPLITGLLQFILSAMMMPAEEAAPNKKEQKDDFQSAFQTQSLFIFPAMIAFSSYILPVGLSLYWNTFTIFGILHQYKLGMTGKLGTFLEKYGRKDKKDSQ
jgi:YidC/Oxa1 family membrane protein insertase